MTDKQINIQASVSDRWESEDMILKNIVKTFNDGKGGLVYAVNDISLTITKGEFVTLLGPSGCGKTTTLRVVAGFETLDSGEIVLGNKKINNLPAYSRNMPMVFQSYALFPHLSIFENIAYGLKIRKVPRNVIKNDVEMVLHLVNLVGLENRYPGELSGGAAAEGCSGKSVGIKA